MPRSLLVLVVAVAVASATGFLPALAAIGDCCGDACGGEAGRAEDEPGCADEQSGEDRHAGEGEGAGCRPLCQDCVCAAYTAAWIVGELPRFDAEAIESSVVFDVIDRPMSRPPAAMFHPPRGA